MFDNSQIHINKYMNFVTGTKQGKDVVIRECIPIAHE